MNKKQSLIFSCVAAEFSSVEDQTFLMKTSKYLFTVYVIFSRWKK